MLDVFGLIIVIWIGVYTLSFGIWTWGKNKFGGFMVILLAISTVLIPLYVYIKLN